MAHRHGERWRGSVKLPGMTTALRKGGFATKGAAEQWEADTAVDLRRGTWRDPDAGAVSFGEWADRFLATRGTLKRSSSSAEKAIIETHLKPAFGTVRLDDIGPTAVRTFVSGLIGRRAPKTVRNIHAVLYGVFELAVVEGLVVSNPCKGTRLPRNLRRKARAFLTEQQVEQLIAQVGETYRPLVVVLATTGLRWGEAAGLKVRWVNVLERHLRVEETVNETGGVLRAETPKTAASVRRVDLAARTLDVLIPLVSGKGPDEYVFQAAGGGPVRHRVFYTRCWVPAVKALGWADPQPSPHDLRHAHAASLIAQGVGLTAIKERLGHDSITTTDKLYGFLLPRAKDGVVDALDAVYGDPLAEAEEPAKLS